MRFDKLGRSFVLATLFAGVGATLSFGCAENRTSVFIYNVLTVQDGCTIEPGADQPFMSRGIFAVGPASRRLPESYSVNFQVASQLTRTGDATVLRPETGYFSVEGAEINLLSGDAASTLQSYSMVTTATVPPATGNQPGFGIVDVLVIPAEIGRTLNDGDSVIAEVRIFGKSRGGIDLETTWSAFPIDVFDIGTACSPEYCETQFMGCGD